MKKTNPTCIRFNPGTAGQEFILFMEKSILLSLKRRGVLNERQCESCTRCVSEKRK